MSVDLNNKEIMFEFFETIYNKSDLFKLRKKVDKKQQELSTKKKLTAQNKEKKQEELKELKKQLLEQREKSAKGEIRNWINSCVKNAMSLNRNHKDTAISLATHVAKLTHSSINWATSIYCQQNNEKPYYLTTSSLKNLQLDVAHPDLKLAPISKFFLFLHNKKIIITTVKSDILNVFKPFSINIEEFKSWKKYFSLYYGHNPIATHYLAKQIYFPIDDNDNYHLLNPMASSSLDQEIYDRLNYDEEMIDICKHKYNDQRY